MAPFNGPRGRRFGAENGPSVVFKAAVSGNELGRPLKLKFGLP